MPKSLKIKKMSSGNGIVEDLAPIAVDALVKVAKKKISGGDIITDLAQKIVPMLLSGGQIRRLKKGGAITINPNMMNDSAETALKLLPASAQKIMKSLAQNKGVRYVLKQGEDLINRVSGQGIFDSIKSIAKSVAPVATSVAKELAPIALDIGADYAKKRVAGSGMRRKKMGCGSAELSKPYKDSMNFVNTIGHGLYPAGERGSGIYPAGMEGGALPIQLGSPYIRQDSPAMRPFFEAGNPYRYAPLNKHKQGGDIGSDILSGLQTVAKFAPLATAFL